MRVNFNKREAMIIGVAVITGLVFGGIFFSGLAPVSVDQHDHSADMNGAETIWTCSMHPNVRADQPGKCPICGMDLIPLADSGMSDETIGPDEIQLSEAAIQLADIRTVKVKRGNPEQEIYLSGIIEADERRIAELSARFGGRIEKLSVNYTGQRVRKGHLLATIYSPDLISAQQELLEAMAFKENNPSFYRAAKSKLKLWNLSEKQILAIEQKGEPELYFEILAPISGTVSKRYVAQGDYIEEGSALFDLVDLSRLWVMLDANESDLPWIRIGDRAEITVKSVPDLLLKGKVTFIDPFIDARTRVAQVRVELPNPSELLKPKMFADGIIYSQRAIKKEFLLIPKSAILWTGQRAVVYVRVLDREIPTFVYREVKLGAEAGDQYVVEQGLQEGEVIAANGVFKIDAAAQLAGKKSMMNPGEATQLGLHEHQSTKTGMDEQMGKNLVTTTFKVAGNCSMCKNRIEKAARTLPGIKQAVWDVESKILKVSYITGKVEVSQIHKVIAAAGHDTEKETAPDEVYLNLPACCTYRK